MVRRCLLAWAWAGLAVVCLTLAGPRAALARANGLAVTDCTGCHIGGKPVTVNITPSLSTVAPGQTVRLMVQIQALNGSKGGVYFTNTQGVGKLSLVSGEPMKLAGTNGATHSSPKSSSGGFVTFSIDWTAPPTPGSVEFYAYGLSANGDNTSSGDGAGVGYLSDVFGCTGTTYYQDNDGDGHGSKDSPARLACSPPMLSATSNDDCDDGVETTYPGAPELCNKVDDNCNGQVDEGLTSETLCTDADGDGHGVKGMQTMMGCGASKGFGTCDNDCNDADPTIYPGATEQCNYKDDNCNGQVDENARATCGTGWCRRSSAGCNAALCEPGPPAVETCNALDDDCDGEVDNASGLCPSGQTCVNGSCIGAGGGASDGGTSARSDAGAVNAADSGKAPAKDASSDDSAADDSLASSGCALRGRAGYGSLASGLLTMVLGARRRRRTR